MTSIVLAAEEELVRAGLAALLEATGRYTVVGQTGDGFAAFQMVRTLRPQAAVLDLELPKLHTLEVLTKLRNHAPEVRLIVVTSRRDRKTVVETLRCGAHGLVLKSGPASHLYDAVDQALRGGVYITPLLSLERVFVGPKSAGDRDPLGMLSTREYQVFTLLIEGIRAKEIAARLDLSPKTVDTYRASLMKKLDIHDVAGLVKYAMKRNLISAS